MNKNYNLKLDLQFRCNNSIMKFNEFDNNTSDFFMRITNGGKLIDIEKAIVVLAVIKPSGKVSSQFVEIENGLVYADLKPNMRDEIGTYTAQAMLILEDERVVTDVISYEVEEGKIFSLLNDTVETSEEFTLLTDMLSRLSTIEISEEQRVINEAERILSEENRKIEETKRVEAELIRQHEEADRTKYDAIRESNENIRKQNESIRLANETNRVNEEAKRVEEEANRVEAEQLRKDNYNFMTEDEERRRLEANAHKEAEVLRVQAETNRVNEEAKRRISEQARVSAENTRVSNENIRKTNEETRQNNETKRVEAETQRQNRYNSFIADAEANASNFENYTNTAKVKEEERKSNELDRKSQEDRRVSNEVERISNENTRKANEVVREKNETSRQNVFENKVDEVDKKIIEINTTKDNFVSSVNTKVDTKISELNTTKDNFISSINTKVDNKISEIDKSKSDMTNTVANKVNEVENRFNALTSKQQQDAEVIDARDGETSLKARLDRDIEKAKEIYAPVEGSHISTDSSVGYLKGVEILGNTIQSASNLADIRSVGDKVEGQELYEIPVLSCGKNLFKSEIEVGCINSNGNLVNWSNYIRTKSFIRVSPNTNYIGHMKYDSQEKKNGYYAEYDNDFNFIKTSFSNSGITTDKTTCYIKLILDSNSNPCDLTLVSDIQLEEGTQATEYEPYVEDKLTILSPTPLEKVGDVRDRIIEKDGVWGVEKNVVGMLLNETNCTISMRNSGEVHPNYALFDFSVTDTKSYVKTGALLCDKINHLPYSTDRDTCDKEGCWLGSAIFFTVKILKSKLESVDVNGMKKWLKTNNLNLKYLTTNPQFIPLPHDQQIKLRTFANKTNISFGCEIEGTIKAQVPKSLGATVNTHTEQIRSLNNELNRVKKLEESTVSTVITESGFTTVEQTTNGYFEDVKLEGKTLVNLATQPTNNGSINHQYATISTVTNIKPSTEYTYIIRNNGSETLKLYLNTNGGFDWFDLDVEANSTVMGKAKTLPTIEGDIWLSLSKAETIEQNLQVVLLEGDHTQNPPNGYIEGLKSVGQSATTSEDGVDEIVVSSVNGDGNLFDKKNIHLNKFLQTNGDETSVEGWFVSDYIKVADTCYIKGLINVASSNLARICVYTQNKTFKTLLSQPLNTTLNISSFIENGDYIRITEKIEQVDNIVVCKNEISNQIYQSDKKRLLYYNGETQTWEKPILREWDSIEKHADGKYYYHQRSGEVVLNGSENWEKVTPPYTEDANIYFCCRVLDAVSVKRGEFVSDRFNKEDVYNTDKEGLYIYNTSTYKLRININKSKLSTQDLQGFKQWLQANNVTVVYQLAQEKVYECTNIDLITYNGETNYIVESGVLSPRTTLKVHNNISNVVSLLQKKVSLLESNVKASQEVQDMMILETDMRMLDIELALMEFIPMTLNLGGSNMLRSATYFNFLKNHIINETYEKEYLENVMNKYLATGRINQDEYDELYKMLYPPVYDIELPIEY